METIIYLYTIELSGCLGAKVTVDAEIENPKKSMVYSMIAGIAVIVVVQSRRKGIQFKIALTRR